VSPFDIASRLKAANTSRKVARTNHDPTGDDINDPAVMTRALAAAISSNSGACPWRVMLRHRHRQPHEPNTRGTLNKNIAEVCPLQLCICMPACRLLLLRFLADPPTARSLTTMHPIRLEKHTFFQNYVLHTSTHDFSSAQPGARSICSICLYSICLLFFFHSQALLQCRRTPTYSTYDKGSPERLSSAA
jgi:hypothetical protein